LKQKKVVVTLTLILALVLSACSGNTAGNSTGNNSGSTNGGTTGTNSSGAPVTLDTFIAISPRVEDINTNTVTKHLQDTLNIQFKFESAPSSNAEDKKKLILASGDYPSVFLSGNFSQSEQIDYGKQGVLIPLNDLIEEYGNEIKRALEEDTDLKAAITAPDGNIYALPDINDCFHCWYSQKMWINKLWLDKLGLPMPKTTEDFFNVLMAFKTQDPNGNGKADEIPLTGAYGTWHGVPSHFLMNSFVYDDDNNFFEVKGGKVELAAAKPEWRQGLEYVGSLYREGLIDKEAFTQNDSALYQVGNREGDNIIGAVTAGHIGMAFSTQEGQERHKDYVALPPLTGPNGVAYAGYYKGYGGGQFAITNKASKEQQIAAIKMADYMYSEEYAIINSNGLEGKLWVKASTGENDFHGNQAKYKNTPAFFEAGDTTNEHWDQMGIARRTAENRESWVAPSDPMATDGYEFRLFLETADKYENKQPQEIYPPAVFIDADDAKDVNMLRPQINDYINSNMAQFITGSKKLTDSEWDSYMKGFDGLNLSRYLEIYQKAFDRANSK
jgi:putative aldouronate transport system substrate-binding protein